MPRLPPAPELVWSAEGAPEAAAFGDVYFSREGGLAEADAVFLRGCGLPGGWQGRSRFTIGELGFGAGINVLAAWSAWKKTRSPHAILHIFSIEAYPLAATDAARAHAYFPEAAELSAALLARWPVRAYAPQRLWFETDGFALTLLTGDVLALLSQLEGRFDAWFLDGFAPARNPAMWRPEVLQQVARLSAPGARAATFTVAGDVRRGLEAVGFEVAKAAGFGRKRERLEARFTGAAAAPPTGLYPYAAVHPERVAIVGAGIAGAACVAALAKRGVETIVLEAGAAAGQGASGNPAGLVMPRLDRGGVLSGFHLAAYLHAVAAYEAMGADIFVRTGVEQRAEGAAQAALTDLVADPPLPEDWMAPAGAAALHLRAGLVRPRAAIAHMLRGAEVLTETPAHAFERAGEGWIVRAPDGRAMLKADAIVLACGAALGRFAPAAFLPIALSRGQIEWGRGPAPAHALTQGSYVAPFEGGVLFGATFDRVEQEMPVAADAPSRARNLAALAQLAPEIAVGMEAEALNSRAALRATTPDRAPIAGLLPDAPAWLAQYAMLAHGAAPPNDAPPPAHAGVCVLGGLGARGFTLAPLLGERIAAELCGEPAMVSQRVLDALHPARFLHRALKRRLR